MKRFVMLFAMALSMGGCSLEVANPLGVNSGPSDPTKETFDPSLNINIASMTKTEAGTYYRDQQVGAGATLTGNTVIVVSYLGLLKNGAEFIRVADQTLPLQNLVGGLQDALRGMKVGGERIVVVPSVLGFGALGSTGVPPHSTLVYDVKLKSIP